MMPAVESIATRLSERRILVTGASGFLGTHFIRRLDGIAPLLLVGRQGPVVAGSGATEWARLDLCEQAATHALLERFRPDLVFHLAALADVDHCERQPAAAIAANVTATAHLADWIATRSPHTRLVLTSTDQVYDGRGPHREDTVLPRNVYALSKLGAEAVATRCARHLILRVNFVGHSPLRRGFADWLLGALARGERPTLVDDVLFNPLHADDLCALALELASGDAQGVLNLGAGGPGWSKARFGLHLLDALGITADRVAIGSITTLPLAAHRPLDMRMDVGRAQGLLGRALPNLDATVERLARDFGANTVPREPCHD